MREEFEQSVGVRRDRVRRLIRLVGEVEGKEACRQTILHDKGLKKPILEEKEATTVQKAVWTEGNAGRVREWRGGKRSRRRRGKSRRGSERKRGCGF